MVVLSIFEQMFDIFYSSKKLSNENRPILPLPSLTLFDPLCILVLKMMRMI